MTGVPHSGQHPTLTVVIPTRNAAPLLTDALESVAFADEIIVVDMHSTDETSEVCARHPQCRLVEREDYIFGNVNYGFELARGDWVMRLDSDERVTPELAAEIKEIVGSSPDGIHGYEFWERPFVLGKELSHGFGKKHYRPMLFRRGSARHAVESEHESLETTGTWVRARNGYLHYNYRTVGEYLRKIDYYTDRDVERMVLSEAPRVRTAIVEPIRAFYLYYLKYQGYRDGWIGFLDATMRSVYQFVQWAKVRERWEHEMAPTS
ncbi:MAG TPA: glycosyltransferase family 2 protein [Acidimicrobiales bacterium]|nr:glycosyltransferase family 2 protein [Acidimicrobiales bacterium]